ncbi:MAG: hypothetical protein Q9216_002013 [Gyalolechia sp. 2 TL-2023]
MKAHELEDEDHPGGHGESGIPIASLAPDSKRLRPLHLREHERQERQGLAKMVHRFHTPSVDASVPTTTRRSAGKRAPPWVDVERTTRHRYQVVPRPGFRRLFFACILAFPVVLMFTRIVSMLLRNRYASDQTLIDLAAQVYATHTSLPLLYAHIIPTVTFPFMFKSTHFMTRVTVGAIEHEYLPCPIKREQSSQLLPPLMLLDASMNNLKRLVDGKLHLGLTTLSERLRIRRPVERLHEAVQAMERRSHRREVLICALELFPLLDFAGGRLMDDRGINLHGLRPLEEYSVDLDRELDKVMPLLAEALFLLLDIHDRYNNVFTITDHLGLSHCHAALESSLSRYQHTSKDEVVVIPIPHALSAGFFHYWSIFTLLHRLRCDNVLLYTKANAYLPPREFWPWDVHPNSSTFDRPPWREAAGARRLAPLQVKKSENDTVEALARGFRSRRIFIDAPDQWVWDHPSTADSPLRPFPSQVPCPPGLKFPINSSSSFLCKPLSPPVSPPSERLYPSARANPETTTYNKLLGLRHLCDVFAIIRDQISSLYSTSHKYSSFIATMNHIENERKYKRLVAFKASLRNEVRQKNWFGF